MQPATRILICGIYSSDCFMRRRLIKCEIKGSSPSLNLLANEFCLSLFRSYGYMTNTKIKFILVVDSLNSAFRENEIRTIFRNIHQEYVNFISNPFIMPNEPIFSKYALWIFNFRAVLIEPKQPQTHFAFRFSFSRTFDKNIRGKIDCYGAPK